MSAKENPKRLNVIWIFGDQHRGQALGCAGDANLTTPNIDRMATEGVHFTRAVSGFPLCCPYRGSLITSRYPHKCVPGHEYPLDSNLPTVAAAFRDAGYHTAYFGKWHLAGWKECDGRAAMYIVPPEQRGGFDVWTGYDNNNRQWDCWVHGGVGDEAFHRRLDGYETDALTDMLIDHLRSRSENGQRDQPFFAALSVQPPHGPYVAPESWMSRHTPGDILLRPNVPNVERVVAQARRDLAGYYAQIENIDWNVGRIRRALEETGQAENTLLIFFSDHGDQHGSHGQFHKMSPYEEAIRVPMVIAPARADYRFKSAASGVPVNHVDMAPTTLGLCGIETPEWMSGTDYSGHFIRGREPAEPPRDSAYLQSVIPTGHGDSVDRPWRGVVTRDGWKYTVLPGQPFMMFNLNEDPYEQVNLAYNTRFRAERRRLQELLAGWIADTDDEFELPEV
ncbi:MAG: sulfatase [Planctomycetota bacterium]